jgi:hypothetical protein
VFAPATHRSLLAARIEAVSLTCRKEVKDMFTWKTRLTAAVLAVLALLGVGVVEASSADAAKKVCIGVPPPDSLCGNIGGPYWG